MANSSPTTYGDDCVLMLKCDGADASTSFPDSSLSNHSVTAVGDAQIDTAQSKFGGASALFDGSGDYLSVPDSSDWDMADFTIDFWVRLSSTSVIQGFLGRLSTTDSGWLNLYWNNTLARIEANVRGVNGSFSWSPSANTWYHLAFIRDGSTFKTYVDGIALSGSITSASALAPAGAITFGRADNFQLNGWIDELRIVSGQAIWTSNFTPPTAEYTDANAVTAGLSVLGRRPIRSIYRGVMR